MKSAVLLLLPFCILIAACSSAPVSPDGQAEKAQQEKQFQTVFGGAVTLRERMRDPESLKFASVVAMDDGAVCYGYRARNGFGGMNAGQALLRPAGDLVVGPSSGFVKEWNGVCAHKVGADLTQDMNIALEQYASTHP